MSAIRSNDPKDRQTQALDAARAQQQQQQQQQQAAGGATGAPAPGGDRPAGADALDGAKNGFKPQFTRELETKAAAGQKSGDKEDPAQERAREDVQTQKVADILRDQLQQKRV